MNTSKIEECVKNYYSNPTQETKEKLIVACAGLVKLIANKLYVQNVNTVLSIEDYEQNGILGLLDAIDKFSYDFNVKFETYASMRIKGAIIDNLRSISPIKRSGLQKKKEYQQAVEKTIDKYGYHYTKEQFLEVSGKSEEELIEIEKITNIEHMNSIEMMFRNRDDDEQSFDIKDTTFPLGEERVLKSELYQKVKEALDKLTERERQVMSLIYIEECTQAEVAAILGISPSRISQVVTKAIAKMRVYLVNYVNM